VTESPQSATCVGPEELRSAVPAGERTKSNLLAALLSLIPGAGHLYRGHRHKGVVLLTLLSALLIGFLPLRLLHFYFGFCLLYCGWVAIYVYAPVRALLTNVGSSPKRTSKSWLILFVPLSLIAAELLGVAVTRASGFRSFEVPSTSMERTIQKGDRIVADMGYYDSRQPERDDVIIFRNHGLFVVKRVIAIAGDTVVGKSGVIFLNGQTLDEPFVEHTRGSAAPWLNTFGPVTKYFVMGDNRDVSLDSRSPEIGLIERKSIVGKTLYIFVSGRQGGKVQ
jgi:signal peptidase I